MNPKKIKIGCASAFWGDTSSAARQLVEKGDIDYLVSDFLAEMTMSILAGSKKNNPKMGYATDFIDQLSPLLKMIISKNIIVKWVVAGFPAIDINEWIKSFIRNKKNGH